MLDQLLQPLIYDVTPTASALEITYALLALLGVIVMIYTAADNIKDQVAMREYGLIDEIHKLIVSVGIWEAIAGALCHSVFLALGTFALLTPPVPASRRWQTALFSLGFIFIQMVIVSTRVRNQWIRIRIRRLLRKGGLNNNRGSK